MIPWYTCHTGVLHTLCGCFADVEQGPAHSPWVMQSRNLFGLISARSPGILTSGAELQLRLHWQLSGGLSSWARMGWRGGQASENLSMEKAKLPVH